MQPLATPSENAEQARSAKLQLSGFFAEVFGQPGKRTMAQKTVIEHLSTCAADDGNSYRFNDAKDGVALIAAGIHRDGARSLLRIIDRQLSIAANVREPKKAKPKTTR